MCLVLLALRAHPRFPVVIAANRDERYDRPTRPAGWWDDAPHLLAGRDLRGGGTWMGVTRAGRWAAVTNFHDPAAEPRAGAPSRGTLVEGFLRGGEEPERYLARLAPRAPAFNGFTLLAGDARSAFSLSNRDPEGPAPRPIPPGVHGLGNHLLDTPWPKVVRGKEALARLLDRPDPDPAALLDLLLDRTLAADHPPAERPYSAAFVLTPRYGTRASTALLLGDDGAARFVERTFHPATLRFDELRFPFLTKL